MIFYLLFLFPLFHQLPDEFTVTERVFSLVSTFDIACNEGSMGSATKRFFALSSIYDLKDSESNPIATAKARFFSWGTIADIEDAEGNSLGHIEENLWKFLPWADYKVFDANNREIMLATLNLWGTEFTLTDPVLPDRIFATMSRPFFRLFRDRWTIKIEEREVFESGSIDPRTLILLSIYQTDKENRVKFYTEYYDQLRQDFERSEGN